MGRANEFLCCFSTKTEGLRPFASRKQEWTAAHIRERGIQAPKTLWKAVFRYICICGNIGIANVLRRKTLAQRFCHGLLSWAFVSATDGQTCVLICLLSESRLVQHLLTCNFPDSSVLETENYFLVQKKGYFVLLIISTCFQAMLDSTCTCHCIACTSHRDPWAWIVLF